MTYPIQDGIPVPKKRRSLKYEWDTDIIKTVVAARKEELSLSWMAAIHNALTEKLTNDQLDNLDTHYRRIYDRIKLMYPNTP